MNKITTIITVLVIGLVAGIVAYMAWTALSPGSLNQDLYPLYPNATWQAVKSSEVNGAAGYEVVSDPITNVTDAASSSTSFEQYYQSKLGQAGWTQGAVSTVSAPGANASVYTKGNDFIVVSHQTTYHGGTQTCPCDLQFTLVSGTAK